MKMMQSNRGRESAILKIAVTQPTRVLVSTVNALISILKKRGVKIQVFGEPAREFHSFRLLGNTAYFMILPAEAKTEVPKDGDKTRK
jgi:hypothetical protein